MAFNARRSFGEIPNCFWRKVVHVRNAIRVTKPITARFSFADFTFSDRIVRPGLLFDGGSQPLHGLPGSVVHLEQHIGHALQRFLHPVAGADRVLLPPINGGVGLLDGCEDGTRIDFESYGFSVHCLLGEIVSQYLKAIEIAILRFRR
jgi:hypothetical protein